MNDELHELQPLRDYIRRESGYSGDIDVEQDLLAAEILDSFSIVSLAIFAQEQFGVEFETEDLTRENLARLSSLIGLIRRTKEKGAAESGPI